MSKPSPRCACLALLLIAGCTDGNSRAKKPPGADPGDRPSDGPVIPTDQGSTEMSSSPTGGSGGPVPEPTTLLLFGSGLVMITLKFRRRRAKTT